MKVFLMDLKDGEGCLMDLARRAQDVGHEVKYWTPEQHPVGRGLVDRVREWRPAVEWADLIVPCGNCDYPKGFEEVFGEGLPIFGANPRAAELELDRGLGQKVLKECGIETLPYQVVSSPEEGIRLIAETDKAYVMKPWGGDANKAMTCVASSPEDAIYILEKWDKEGLFKGELMLQEKAEGVEIGVSAFFGPGGWNRAIEESFEHKKLMVGELGPNTGEMGTVIRHVNKSLLFDKILEPLTDHLHYLRYVGDCSVNCIVDRKGTPWPLEFTMRLGWPDFCIRQALIQGDPVEWMLDLLYGRDTLRVSSEIAVGVLIAHGDFPREDDPPKEWGGFPIRGIDEETYSNVHYQQVADGEFPMLVEGRVKRAKGLVTAGQYVMVVTGTGETVSEAQKAAYRVVEKVRWPSAVMYRTDIADRLRGELPELHEHGYAVGMEY